MEFWFTLLIPIVVFLLGLFCEWITRKGTIISKTVAYRSLLFKQLRTTIDTMIDLERNMSEFLNRLPDESEIQYPYLAHRVISGPIPNDIIDNNATIALLFNSVPKLGHSDYREENLALMIEALSAFHAINVEVKEVNDKAVRFSRQFITDMNKLATELIKLPVLELDIEQINQNNGSKFNIYRKILQDSVDSGNLTEVQCRQAFEIQLNLRSLEISWKSERKNLDITCRNLLAILKQSRANLDHSYRYFAERTESGDRCQVISY